MPIVLVFALVGSLAIHGAALFGTDVELFGGGAETIPLRVEIQPPAQAIAAVDPPLPEQLPAKTPAPKPVRKAVSRKSPPPLAPVAKLPAEALPENVPESALENAPETMSTAAAPPPAPARPLLPASGVIRFAINKESLGLQVGRAEHRWEFREDGSYRLTGVTETSGLAALLKPVRLEVESSGHMVVGGLQPERLRSLKNGKDSNENADFDWSTAEVRLSRDGSVRAVAPGAQDILSLNYQLAYLGRLADGRTIGVVTGKKYERYSLDSLGEEDIEVPAGRFRTLHLRAMTDNTTEIWLALDHERLPVKIRFTDKKGESFEQVATELGMQ